MKITKSRLNQLIKEELDTLHQEGFFDTVKGIGSTIATDASKIAGGIKSAFTFDFDADYGTSNLRGPSSRQEFNKSPIMAYLRYLAVEKNNDTPEYNIKVLQDRLRGVPFKQHGQTDAGKRIARMVNQLRRREDFKAFKADEELMKKYATQAGDLYEKDKASLKTYKARG